MHCSVIAASLISGLCKLVIKRSVFLQPVKPRWPCICICMYMDRVRVSVAVRVRVCHDMFRTRSPMFDRLQK